jgi:hypothetical protein
MKFIHKLCDFHQWSEIRQEVIYLGIGVDGY